jgi:molybdate transport system regulatory protein
MTASKIAPRIRIWHGKACALGPGKADLLALISETGSITNAAKRLKMSYMRAWQLVQVMNDCFHEPLVRTVRGGAGKGGARLTECGEHVLQLYREMEDESLEAVQSRWKTIQQLLIENRGRQRTRPGSSGSTRGRAPTKTGSQKHLS